MHRNMLLGKELFQNFNIFPTFSFYLCLCIYKVIFQGALNVEESLLKSKKCLY